MKTSLKANLLTALALSGAMLFIKPAFARVTSSIESPSVQETREYLVADSLQAQWRRSRYDANDGQMQQLLDSIERRTDRFRDRLDSELDNSRLNGSRREDNINQFVRDFEQATSRLRDRFNKRESVDDDVREVLNRASRIDNFLRRRRLGEGVESDWARLSQDLDKLARSNSDSASCLNDDRQVRQLLDSIARRTDKFRSVLDSELDKSRLNGSRREDNINQSVRDFEQVINRLRDRSNKNESVNDDVRETLNRASRIDNFLRRRRLGGDVESQWSRLRQELDELARRSNCFN